jgi:Peptidase MA superfamily
MRWRSATSSAGRSATRWASAAALAAAAVLAAPAQGAGDRGADGRFDERTSAHFALYQDVAIDQTGGFNGSRRFEQGVLDELERAYERLDVYLGLRPPRRIDVVIYDPGVFERQFQGLFRFSAAGFYQGVIRVRGDTRLTVELSRVLHHELVHAAFDAAAPSLILPGWVNEGSAEWFEARALGKRGLAPEEQAFLVRAGRAGALLPLAALNVPSFSRLGPQQAQIAYLQSYALIDYLVRSYGERKLPQFYDQLFRSRSLERALERTYRLDSATLEARLLAELS